jgi:hypothetical protein
MKQVHDWDTFLARAGADKAVAERIYDLLAPHYRIFLDSAVCCSGMIGTEN